MEMNVKWAMMLSCIVLSFACNRVKKIESVDSDSADNPQTTDSGGTDSQPLTGEVIDEGTEAIGSCEFDWKTTESGFGIPASDGVDILVVVDNSGSMADEQEILATSFFTLLNSLSKPVPGWPFDAISNIRIGITTSDMGVSYNGTPYEETDPNSPLFDTPQVLCGAIGDNGAFQSDYNAAEVMIREGVIACGEGATQCPPGWTCENIDAGGVGRCMNPNGADAPVACPASPEERAMDFVSEEFSNDRALMAACLANVGGDGCNYEQQLMAGAAGLENNLESFLRPRALTVVLIVSDEEDCSIKSKDWHKLDELQSVTANLACGRHPEFLMSVADIKARYDDAIAAVKGAPSGVIFAAVVGVPYDESGGMTVCEGPGSALGDCGDVKPAVNGGGTMNRPDEVGRMTSSGIEQFYFEYACERYADDAGPDDRAVTSAYPGMRYVEMAQLYGDMGLVYSICREDWTPMMTELAGMIGGLAGGSTCFSQQLQWDPATETSDCDLIFDYYFSKSEYPEAPACPTDDGQKWADAGTVSVVSSPIGEVTVEYWKRSCAVKKLAVPYNCDDATAETIGQYMLNEFGWFYCENSSEDNSTACGDGVDNDRDGLIDVKDPDCEYCLNGAVGCGLSCPHEVRLTNPALNASMVRDVKAVHLVCTDYTPADNNPDECHENSVATCNDGKDNDLDGAFDCWNYAQAETGAIPPAHFPAAGARRADGSCCPMRVSTDGTNRCEFLNTAGESVGDNHAQSAHVERCNTGTSVSQIPDACCTASAELLCALPRAIRDECASRGL